MPTGLAENAYDAVGLQCPFAVEILDYMSWHTAESNNRQHGEQPTQPWGTQ
jgi:hypothetical protein